jgi:hypothetical protein
MGRVPKPDLSRSVGPMHPMPAPADYFDEITDDQIKRIEEVVRETLDEEELEVVDGPAW